jgi:hypothetical protein
MRSDIPPRGHVGDASSSTGATLFRVSTPTGLVGPARKPQGFARTIEKQNAGVVIRAYRSETLSVGRVTSEHTAPRSVGTPWLQKAREKLLSLSGALPGCRQSPSKDAIDAADSALRVLFDRGIKPARISPMADGGVSIHFVVGEGGSARVEFANDGELVLVVQADAESEREYYQLASFAEAMDKLCTAA